VIVCVDETLDLETWKGIVQVGFLFRCAGAPSNLSLLGYQASAWMLAVVRYMQVFLSCTVRASKHDHDAVIVCVDEKLNLETWKGIVQVGFLFLCAFAPSKSVLAWRTAGFCLDVRCRTLHGSRIHCSVSASKHDLDTVIVRVQR
jgi:hypothetical protein